MYRVILATACLAPMLFGGCATSPSSRNDAEARGLLIQCEASSLRPPPPDAEALRQAARANATLHFTTDSASEYWLSASDDAVILCIVDDSMGEWWRFAPGSDRIAAHDAYMIMTHPRRR